MAAAGRAIILGAGVAGLAAAWWLTRFGWRCEVIERATALRAGGYVMGFAGPGYRVARHMGLLPAIRETSLTPGTSVFRDRRGRKLLALRHEEYIAGVDYLIVRRGDLVLCLARAVGERAPIRTGVTVTRVTDDRAGVIVRLSDGSSAAGDVLVVAEGVRSATRAIVFPEHPDPFRFLGYRFGAYDVATDVPMGEEFAAFVAPGCTSEFYRIGPGRMAALHIWNAPRRREPGGPAELDELARRHASDPPLVRTAIAAAREQSVRPVIDDFLMVEMPCWARGRVVLLGDAAHCLTLISGQGASAAMAAAASLARALAEARDIEAGLAAHEATLRPVVAQMQRRSRALARWFVPQTQLAYTARNMVLRVLPQPLLARHFRNVAKQEWVGLADLEATPPRNVICTG